MRKQEKRGEEGVTLIVFIIIIVVLLVLVGIVINISKAKNGILNKSKFAGETYINNTNEEIEKIGSYNNEIDKYVTEIASNRNDNNSSGILDFEIEIKEINANFVTVKVKKITSNTAIFGYIALLNGKPVEFTKNQEYTFSNLDKNKEYKFQLVAVDENIKTKWSNIVTGKTTNVLYLYNRGDEYTSITGGWTINESQVNGKAAKNKDNMLIYYSSNSSSDSSCITAKKVDLTKFSKLYIVYKKEKAYVGIYSRLRTSLGNSASMQNGEYKEEFDCSNFNDYLILSDCDAYDYIYEVYAE